MGTDVVADAAWVTARMADGDIVILECEWGPARPGPDGPREHLPGAIYVNTDDFEMGPPAYFLKPTQALRATIEKLGITAKTPVVVYSSWPLAAARCWWILSYMGVEDVRFLNGGYAAWRAMGGAVETTVNAPGPSRPFGKETPARPEWLVDTAQMEKIVQLCGSDTKIVDVRSLAEYSGQTSGYRSLEARGRIPGALWGRDACGEPGSAYLSPDGSLRSADEIRRLWSHLGLTPEKRTIFYCGGGWRSSLALLYAQLLGFSDARNYSDGWFAWSARPVAASGP